MDREDKIPIQNPDEEDPFLDEASEGDILEEDLNEDIEISSDYGGHNEIVSEETGMSAHDIGDTFIMLLESKDSPFLARITEISVTGNNLKMKDDSDKILSFLFDNGDIIHKTTDYEIIDMIKVISYEPIKDDDDDSEYKEMEFYTEELLEKVFSELAQKDDLLSTLIHSMNIYENNSKIKIVQETIDILLELINTEKKESLSIPNYFIPIIDDTLKLYSQTKLQDELTEESHNLSGTISYEEYVNNSIRHSKPIETTNGYGLSTDEYSGTYLRNCLQDDACLGVNGTYTYDERKNNHKIVLEEATMVTPNRLRIIGLLEEPYNEYVYSVDEHSLKKFTVFEKYIYEKLNSKMNLYKKDKIKEAFLVTKDDDSDETRDKGKYLLHSLTDNNYEKINDEKQELLREVSSLLINDEDIKDKIYNYNDLEKLLFKYDIKINDLSPSDRGKISDIISINIKNYPKRKFYFKKEEKELLIKKNEISETTRVILSRDIIFKCSLRADRNEYLQKFIDLFTRSSEKEYESHDYLYNKYTDEKLLCKHYLYECNISNDNDLFDTMKTVYGMAPEDGIISCKICGCYLCNEDTSFQDGFDGSAPLSSDVLIGDKESELEIKEYLNDNEKHVKLIKDISDSCGINLTDKDIHEILLSFELLNDEQLSDTRYGFLNVSFTDIHPRVSNKINKIKKLEKTEKDKKKKKEYKNQRENVIYNFQKWLKNTNRILMITALLLLVIQTSIPTYFTNNKKSFIVLDIEDKKINNGVLKYICAKLKRLSEKYKNEEIWNDTLDLFNEKEYDTNEIEIQLGLIVNYCLQPTFPRIVERVSKLEDYIETKKNNFLKVEWPTFKPLQNNLSVIETRKFLAEIDSLNIQSYRKVYGGYTIENNSFIRPMTVGKEYSLSESLAIPEIEVYKSNSFKILLRYVVSLYGNHKNNLFISLTLQKIIEDSPHKDEILKIFTKYGYNNGFKSLNFHKLRNKIVPELLSLYGSSDTAINSCYSDERSCNEFIHVLINNYDLSLLNTLPKRIYSYEPPTVLPDIPFGRLNETKSYDMDNNEIPNMIDKLFDQYQKDEMGELVKKYDENFYTEFYVNMSLIDIQRVENLKFTKFDKNEENYYFILDSLREKNSLEYIPKIDIQREYNIDNLGLQSIKFCEPRFLKYLEQYDNESKLYELFRGITPNDLIEKINSDKLDLLIRNEFSDMILETDGYVSHISNFLSMSDKITVGQKRRFIGIFKDLNTGQIIFNNDNLSSILGLFINDTNLKYTHINGYIIDIQNIISRLKHNTKNKITLPKEWKCTDSVTNEYLKFMDDGQDVYLYLHNNIFVKSKDKYTGFNEYLEHDEYKTYFRFISDKIKHLFIDLDLLKGASDSKYDNRYSNIFMKYHFMKLFNEIVLIITELRNSQSDITSDANDLFQSLEMRDEDIIDDMIDILTRFLMDLITHVMFQHYDPSWLFLNEQKLDLANRLSKQKEREKQVIIDKLDSASREERFAIMEKNKMGISLFYKIGSNQASEYVKSDEYSQQTESERREKLSEMYSSANLELDILQGGTEDNDIADIAEVNMIPQIDEEQQGYNYNEEYDDEDDEEDHGGLDEEQEMMFNE